MWEGTLPSSMAGGGRHSASGTHPTGKSDSQILQTSSSSNPKMVIKGKIALKCKSGVYQKGLLGEISIRSAMFAKTAEPQHDVTVPFKKARHPEPVYFC